jgi:hypothetical protein
MFLLFKKTIWKDLPQDFILKKNFNQRNGYKNESDV